MTPNAIAALLFTAVFFSQNVGPAELWKLPVAPPAGRFAYGEGALQFGELRVPKTQGPHPVVVLVHGGCWVNQLPSRDARDTSFEPLRPVAAALAEQGIATWNLEYRRVGDSGGGWPGSYDDLGAGVDFLRKIASDANLDLERVIAVGHSAGGQLAHWLAARPKLSRSSPLFSERPLSITAVVNVDGPPDLAAAQPLERRFCPVAGITQFLGGTPSEQPERYRDGSAMSMLPLGVPQTIVVGGLLRAVPDLVSGYESVATAKGDSVRLVKLEGGHFDMLAPGSPDGKRLIAAILSVSR
jgi:acetyl esterase/lipase